jgi:hypothetical protein
LVRHAYVNKAGYASAPPVPFCASIDIGADEALSLGIKYR